MAETALLRRPRAIARRSGDPAACSRAPWGQDEYALAALGEHFRLDDDTDWLALYEGLRGFIQYADCTDRRDEGQVLLGLCGGIGVECVMSMCRNGLVVLQT